MANCEQLGVREMSPFVHPYERHWLRVFMFTSVSSELQSI